MCLEIYRLDPVHFFSAPGLAWQADFKKIKVKLDLLTDIDILVMVENNIIDGTCHAIHQYAKANNKYTKEYDKNEFKTRIKSKISTKKIIELLTSIKKLG